MMTDSWSRSISWVASSVVVGAVGKSPAGATAKSLAEAGDFLDSSYHYRGYDLAPIESLDPEARVQKSSRGRVSHGVVAAWSAAARAGYDAGWAEALCWLLKQAARTISACAA